MTPVTEAELVAKAVAPRVTEQSIKDLIASVHYFTAAEGVDGRDIARLRAAKLSRAVLIKPMDSDPEITEGDMPKLATLTICVIVLTNGFMVTGESACASAANFNKEIGERLALSKAFDKIWAFEGYRLKLLTKGEA